MGDGLARLEERRVGERTVAGVKANDEARLLLDFLRHFGGRGVVDGDGSRAERLSWDFAQLGPL